MMTILLELTGARRVAYHPDGFYGISNLSAAMLNHWLSVDQFAPALNGQVGGIGSVEEFLAASVHRQLVVTDAATVAAAVEQRLAADRCRHRRPDRRPRSTDQRRVRHPIASDVRPTPG